MSEKLNEIAQMLLDKVDLNRKSNISDDVTMQQLSEIISRKVIDPVKRGFAKEYVTLRNAQKKYFQLKYTSDLQKAKNLEKELDKKAEAILNPKPNHPTLFK